MDAVPITKKLIAFGSKKIYLPKFTIALIRTPKLSPYHARFLVPLDFSKYDLRDYLYHAYNVRCFNIRSYVKQLPVRDSAEQPRHLFRPESKKYMTVEMEQPFVWPEIPDLAPWGKREKDEEVEDAGADIGAEGLRERARVLREQAGRVLGKERVVESKRRAKAGASEELAKAERERKRLSGLKRVEVWEEGRSQSVVMR